MTDEELAKFLAIPVEHVPLLAPKDRAMYEHMANVEFELALWSQGLGPMPKGVMVDTEQSVRNRRMWQ